VHVNVSKFSFQVTIEIVKHLIIKIHNNKSTFEHSATNP